jgi:hypothetical protein
MAMEFQHNKKGKIVLVETQTGELHEFSYTIDACEALGLKDADGNPRYVQPSSVVGMKRSAEKKGADENKEKIKNGEKGALKSQKGKEAKVPEESDDEPDNEEK